MQNSNRIALKSFFPYFGILLFFFGSCSPFSNDRTISNLENELANISAIQDSEQRQAKTDSLWAELKLNNQIPFIQDTVAIFLYKGSAEQVNWNGDFNSWSSDKKYPNKGTNIEGTDIWMLKTHFPADARLDYKVTVDGDWIIDPENPNTQWSGFGPNSELRMPKWKPEPLKIRTPEAAQGTLSKNRIITSSEFGYTIQYQVYTPPNYAELGDLPVLYVTDGHEYSDDQLGSSVVVLDNLLHQKKIKPVIVVFVDPRNPDDEAINRRSDQFAVNEKYLVFFTETLIPEIESKYKVLKNANQRGILGTSLGGLNAAYFGFARPDVFGKIAIQAPAFWYREEIYDLVRNAKANPDDIYMSVGSIGDNLNDAERMETLFKQRKVHFSYLQVNEGHSWGAWSAQMDDILLQFFGK
tara:strand:- start:7381 stop:8613 length:1233 start_codon:yes stop_codon:yes gene_type:complete